MVSRFGALFFVLLFMSPTHQCGAQELLQWRFWKGRESLFGSGVAAISVGPTGKLWGTRLGDSNLNCWYDGYKTGSLQGPEFSYFIREDRSGQIWGLSFHTPVEGDAEEVRIRGVLEYVYEDDLDEGRWVRTDVEELETVVPVDPIRSWSIPFLPAGRDRLLILSKDRLLEFDANKREVVTIGEPNETGLGFFIHLGEARDGGAWVTGENGLAKITRMETGQSRVEANDKRLWEEYVFPRELALKNPIYPIEGKDGEVFLTAFSERDDRRVLVRFDGDRWHVVYRDRDADIIIGWRGADGHIWLTKSQFVDDPLNFFSFGSATTPELATIRNGNLHDLKWKGDRAGTPPRPHCRCRWEFLV